MTAGQPPAGQETQVTVVPVDLLTGILGHAPAWEYHWCHAEDPHPPVLVCLRCMSLWPCLPAHAMLRHLETVIDWLAAGRDGLGEEESAVALGVLRGLAALMANPGGPG